MSAPWLTDRNTSPGPWGAGSGWQYSANAGSSWSAYNGGSVAEVNGPAGTQRYRLQFNIPAGTTGQWRFTAQGDLFDPPNQEWTIWYDGVQVGSAVGYDTGVVTLPAVPGAHTIEVRTSAATVPGQTQLRSVTATWPLVNPAGEIPCDCCPVDTALYGREEDGPNLLTNGDFAQSSGLGAASTVGPGWTQEAGPPPGGYSPCGPNIFGSPGCSAGSWSFFETNAGQATGGTGNAVPISAIGGRSMVVNVSSTPDREFLQWTVPLINGQTYRFSCQAAMIFGPFAVAVRIDGNRIGALSTARQSQWTYTEFVFEWTGPTGNHVVGVSSDSTVFGGNDHAFDDFRLTTSTPPRAAVLCADGDWYDTEDGHVLDADEIDTIEGCCECWEPAEIEPHLRVMSISWLNPGPPAADEENGDFTPAPSATVGAVSTNPGYFHPPQAGATLAPCDGGTMMEFDFPLTSSVEWTYRRDPNSDTGSMSGNSYYWSAPGDGIANFDFGVHPAADFGLGKVVETPLVNGIKARFELVSVANPSGNINAYPISGDTGCGDGRVVAHNVDLRITDQPMVMRVSFWKRCGT